MNTFTLLQEKINNAKELDFGDILSKTFELFKKTWIQGFLLVLILMVVMIPLFIAIYMPMYSSVIEQIQSGDYDPNDSSSLMQFQTDSFRYMILGFTFVISFISTGLIAGFYRIVKRIDFNESYTFGDFFRFFKGKYLGKIFAIAAFSLMVSMINFGLEKFLPPAMASILSGVLSIILSVYTTLFVVFFAFNEDLESSEIFSLSFSLGTKKWLLIFGLLVVSGIIGFLGVIACGFGLLFTISIVYLPIYFVYKNIFGFTSVSPIDEIGMHNEESSF